MRPVTTCTGLPCLCTGPECWRIWRRWARWISSSSSSRCWSWPGRSVAAFVFLHILNWLFVLWNVVSVGRVCWPNVRAPGWIEWNQVIVDSQLGHCLHLFCVHPPPRWHRSGAFPFRGLPFIIWSTKQMFGTERLPRENLLGKVGLCVRVSFWVITVWGEGRGGGVSVPERWQQQ